MACPALTNSQRFRRRGGELRDDAVRFRLRKAGPNSFIEDAGAPFVCTALTGVSGATPTESDRAAARDGRHALRKHGPEGLLPSDG